jgi:hypothetical protein
MTLLKVERENEERRNRIQEMKKRVEQAVKAKADERQKQQRNAENEDFATNLNQRLFISNSFVVKNSKKLDDKRIGQY